MPALFVLSVMFLVAISFILFAVHLGCAEYVAEGVKRYSEHFGCRSILFDKFIWTLIAFFGGPIVAVVFWLLHCSTLNPRVAGLVSNESNTFLDHAAGVSHERPGAPANSETTESSAEHG